MRNVQVAVLNLEQRKQNLRCLSKFWWARSDIP